MELYEGCSSCLLYTSNVQVEYPYLKEIDSCSLRCCLFNLDDAFKRYYKKQGSYPKFKSKYNSRRFYRTNCISSSYKDKTYQSIEVNLKKDIIKLPKLDVYKRQIVDGEGVRTVVWTQGCPHHCPGCHNASTWDFDGDVYKRQV